MYSIILIQTNINLKKLNSKNICNNENISENFRKIYVGILLRFTCYVSMQANYVDMRLIYVNMQHRNAKTQDKYEDMQHNLSRMLLNYLEC